MPFLPFLLVCFIFFFVTEASSAKPQKKKAKDSGSNKIVIELKN